ncbi:MAG: SDR family oxidoreductase [Methylotenera sp.]|nr:SDR family oxidoreductase [Methylotenera sp.]
MEFALITGASSGIGLELASIMAEKGHNLILVARRDDVLQEIKIKLESHFKIKVVTLALDLSIPNQAKVLYQNCVDQKLTVNCLVNNAGYGDFGKFETWKIDTYQNMLQLNVVALTDLTALFLDGMKKRQSGRILNVGSIAAFQPIPNFSVYAASKAYVMQFTEALNYELRGTGVTATLLSPGVTETGFVARANMQNAANAKGKLMDAGTVALQGYQAMMQGKLNVTPGWKNRLLTFGSRTMPSRELLLRISATILKDSKAN